jgi:hypothetical protein
MTLWLYVTAALTATPMSVTPVTEAQCRALAVKAETVRGHRVAACLAPDGSWFPSPIGAIAPKRLQVARK